MDKKITLVIGVALFLFGVLVGNNLVSPQLSPPDRTAQTNAYKCSADEICEINNALIGEPSFEFEENERGHLVTRGNLYVGNPRVTFPVGSKGYLATEAGAVFGGDIFARDGGIFEDVVEFNGPNEESIKINPALENPIYISSFSGTSDAYVCVTQGGVLFRSQTPCV